MTLYLFQFITKLSYKDVRLASYGQMLFIVIYFSMIKLTNRP